MESRNIRMLAPLQLLTLPQVQERSDDIPRDLRREL